MVNLDEYKNILSKHLDNLDNSDFLNFKRHLKGKDRMNWSRLENSDRYGTVEQIVEVYTIADRGGIILDILRKMNLNQTALNMENDLNIFQRQHGQEVVRNPEVGTNYNSRSTCSFNTSPDIQEWVSVFFLQQNGYAGWIGMKKDNGTWSWIDDTPVSTTYWFDADCSYSKAAICEKPAFI